VGLTRRLTGGVQADDVADDVAKHVQHARKMFDALRVPENVVTGGGADARGRLEAFQDAQAGA
jgi:hypothetical protein